MTRLVVFCVGVLFATPLLASPSSSTQSYPLATCPVSGETLGADAVSTTAGGREVRLCCTDCVDTFAASSETHLSEIDAAIVSTQRPIYPLDVCVVSDEPLGKEAVDVIVDNRLVRLCSAGCETTLRKDIDAAVGKLDAAVVADQLEGYAATVCPISGGKLGSMGDPTNYVYAGRLVRFCCAGCIGAFDADPTTAMAKIE